MHGINTDPKTLDEAKTTITALIERLLALEERNRILEERVRELEARLAKNSNNSSKPPSSDPPWVKRPPKKEKTGRKQGGQPGHEGHFRKMVTPNEIKDYFPDQCGGCAKGLDPARDKAVGEPVRHQVTETPKVEPQVTEHRCFTLECTCGYHTTAQLPAGVPVGEFGPRLLATVAMLSGTYNLGKRAIERILLDLCGVEMSLGSITGCERAVSEAVAVPVEAARQYVEEAAVVNADETGWWEKAKRAWLWVAATSLVAVFMVHANRNGKAARALLRNFAGILTTDRWSAYGLWALDKRQVCWSHLMRDFQFISEHRGLAGAIGVELVRLGKRMFKYWHRVRDGTMSREEFK